MKWYLLFSRLQYSLCDVLRVCLFISLLPSPRYRSTTWYSPRLNSTHAFLQQFSYYKFTIYCWFPFPYWVQMRRFFWNSFPFRHFPNLTDDLTETADNCRQCFPQMWTWVLLYLWSWMEKQEGNLQVSDLGRAQPHIRPK